MVRGLWEFCCAISWKLKWTQWKTFSFECDILTNAVWQCTRIIIHPGHCRRPSCVTMALAHHRLFVQILKSFPADASVPEFLNWFFSTEKWIRNEDLISVLKRTESVQLWLKMFPTPKSGPSRHSLAATTSYFEVLIILSYVCIGRLLRSPLSCLLYRWGFEQGCPRCQYRTPRCTGTSSWCLGSETSGRSQPLLQQDLNSPRWDRGCYRLRQFLWSSPLSLDRHDPSWEIMDDNLKDHSLSPSV